MIQARQGASGPRPLLERDLPGRSTFKGAELRTAQIRQALAEQLLSLWRRVPRLVPVASSVSRMVVLITKAFPSRVADMERPATKPHCVLVTQERPRRSAEP